MTDLEEPGSGLSPESSGQDDPSGQETPAQESSADEPRAGRHAKAEVPAGRRPVFIHGERRRRRRAIEETEKQRSRGLSAVREAAIVLGTALLISLLVKTFLVQAFYIPSASMEPTLLEGDRVLVSRLVPGPLDLHRGDIVVFVDPGDWLDDPQATMNPLQRALITAGEWVGLLPANTGSHLIKRVIGLPGDHVVCCDAAGYITVNGVAIEEPYVMPGSAPSATSFDQVVPADKLWVLGDNRSNSGDSRAHLGSPGGGFVPIDNVVGVAQVRLWPLDRIGLLRNPGPTFALVPDPS